MGNGVYSVPLAFLSMGTYTLSTVVVVVVVVVVSHIQRIGCQPEKAALHGGQSRSWSLNREKIPK